jgi:hypothetical protein
MSDDSNCDVSAYEYKTWEFASAFGPLNNGIPLNTVPLLDDDDDDDDDEEEEEEDEPEDGGLGRSVTGCLSSGFVRAESSVFPGKRGLLIAPLVSSATAAAPGVDGTGPRKNIKTATTPSAAKIYTNAGYRRNQPRATRCIGFACWPSSSILWYDE